MKKKVLVTGSSGMIGTALCERLLAEGFEVTGVDLVANRWSPIVQKKTILVDLRNKKEFQKLPSDCDFFVHLAANAYVFPSVQNPQLAIDNVTMTLNCLEFCRTNGISRFLFASSREVYGNSNDPLHSETDFELSAVESPYASSKVAAEAFVHAYHQCFGIDFQIFRFSNVYGKFDASDRLIPLVIKKNRVNEPVTVFGKDKELSFTYIDDAVDGVFLAVESFERSKNQVFNVAFPTPTKISDVVFMLQTEMGSTNRVIVGKKRVGEVERFTADVSKARQWLGFKPKTTIKAGLKKTVDWYARHLK